MRRLLPMMAAMTAAGAIGGATAAAQDKGAAAAATAELYRAKCAQCHMPEGNSPLEPLNFTDDRWTHGAKPGEVARVIAEGVTGTAMLGFKAQLTPKQVADLAAYVRAFDKSLKAGKGKAGRR
jgi:cytochrome c oxidase cbb3-type subunit 3